MPGWLTQPPPQLLPVQQVISLQFFQMEKICLRWVKDLWIPDIGHNQIFNKPLFLIKQNLLIEFHFYTDWISSAIFHKCTCPLYECHFILNTFKTDIFIINTRMFQGLNIACNETSLNMEHTWEVHKPMACFCLSFFFFFSMGWFQLL